MIRKLFVVFGIIVVLFAGINTAAALNSSIFDAIAGLPLSDQILIIAKEVDRLKLKDELRDACDEAEELSKFPQPLPSDYKGSGGITHNPLPQMVESVGGDVEEWLGSTLTERYRDYLATKAECDRLTEEFSQKYGD